MPATWNRGYAKFSRESAVGTPSTTQLLGMKNGPLSGLITTAFGTGGTSVGIGVPTADRKIKGEFAKAIMTAGVGRRFKNTAMVAGRRSMAGSVKVPICPNTFPFLLYLALGNDVVTPTQSGTLTGAGNTANAVALTVTATSANLKTGQIAFINDTTFSEYVVIGADIASGQTAITSITGGGGTLGGLKNSHAASTAIQYGPWTHVQSLTNTVSTIPTFEYEDNVGGATNSQLYTGCSIDGIDLSAAFDNDTELMEATVKLIGRADQTTVGFAGTGAFSMPSEEVGIATGNAAVWTDPPNATMPSGSFPHIYVAGFKMNLNNNAHLAKAATGSPDPYTSLPTLNELSGSMDTFFEDYSTYKDFATNVVWSPVDLKWTWAASLLVGTTGAVPATFEVKINRVGLEKAGDFTDKDGLVRFPIDSWKSLDYPDFGTPAQAIFTTLNNVATY